METKTLIRKMPNRDLIKTVNKIRMEKQNPQTYGKNGTSRWVTSSEFWGGHHQDLKRELERRKQTGQIKKTAGKPTSSGQGYGFGMKIKPFRF